MKFTSNDIFFIFIISILFFLTNFNVIEGKNKRKKKRKRRKKKLKKLRTKGLNCDKRALKIIKLQNKIEKKRRKKEEKRRKRERKRQGKRKRREKELRDKRQRETDEFQRDEEAIQKHIANNKILSEIRDSKERELQAERSEILNSMTSKNYWELVFGNFNTWKQKYIGRPGVEEQKPKGTHTDFNPISFMLKLDPLSSDFTDSYDADLIPEDPIAKVGKIEIDDLSGKPLPSGPPNLAMGGI